MELTHAELLSVLHYSPEDGTFTWLVNKGSRARIGQEAGCLCAPPSGARRGPEWRIGIDQNVYRRPQLAWFYMTGQWPILEIDHRNGDPIDDRWENLRAATRYQNEINKRKYSNNKSGLKGVRINRGKFEAAIQRGWKRVHLGTFETADSARAAYLAAAAALDGEFLNSR